jgi:Na+/phosphate symporter
MDKLKKIIKVLSFIIKIINYLVNEYETTDFETIKKTFRKRKKTPKTEAQKNEEKIKRANKKALKEKEEKKIEFFIKRMKKKYNETP